MNLQEFKQSPYKKIAKINAVLKEQFGVSVMTGFPKKAKLELVLESAEKAIIQLRGTNKRFQLDPDYAKFLGIRDVVETMLHEGMYAESPAYHSMKEMVEATVRELMDCGYTMDEAVSECMNRYRMDNRFAYDDDHVMPIVITAAKNYMDEGKLGKAALAIGGAAALAGAAGMAKGAYDYHVKKDPVTQMSQSDMDRMTGKDYQRSVNEEDSLPANTDLDEKLLKALAEEIGIKLEDMTSYDAIEEKLNTFAKVSGKSRDAVVGFLNGLDEETLPSGIQYFGRKIGEANAFVDARRKAIAAGEKEFTVGGKTFKVTGDTSDEKKAAKEGLDLDGLIDDMLNEEVDVEQAEVVMAVRALADDIQDQVERIGRMINEELPAIVDQMRSEMGASTAQSFSDTVTGVLNTQLENAKATKVGLDNAVAQLTGGEMAGGLGDTSSGLSEPQASPADAVTEPEDTGDEMDTNEPAASGPESEPLGRAAI